MAKPLDLPGDTGLTTVVRFAGIPGPGLRCPVVRQGNHLRPLIRSDMLPLYRGPGFLDEGEVFGLTGELGKGKTLGLAYFLHMEYFAGRPVYTDLELRSIPYQPLDLSYFIDQLMEGNWHDCALGIDDADTPFSNRMSMTRQGRRFPAFMDRIRKLRIRLYLVSHKPHNVDFRITDKINTWMFPYHDMLTQTLRLQLFSKEYPVVARFSHTINVLWVYPTFVTHALLGDVRGQFKAHTDARELGEHDPRLYCSYPQAIPGQVIDSNGRVVGDLRPGQNNALSA